MLNCNVSCVCSKLIYVLLGRKISETLFIRLLIDISTSLGISTIVYIESVIVFLVGICFIYFFQCLTFLLCSSNLFPVFLFCSLISKQPLFCLHFSNVAILLFNFVYKVTNDFEYQAWNSKFF